MASGHAKRGDSFLRGYASALSIYPFAVHRRRRAFRILETSLAEALERDWVMVGNSLRSAMAEADEREHGHTR